jgi:hypothetical protein
VCPRSACVTLYKNLRVIVERLWMLGVNGTGIVNYVTLSRSRRKNLESCFASQRNGQSGAKVAW